MNAAPLPSELHVRPAQWPASYGDQSRRKQPAYSMKKKITLLIKIVVSVTLLTYLLYKVGVEEIFLNLSSLSMAFILFAWLYYASCQWLSAWRWQFFLTVKGFHVPVKTLFSFYMIGMFLNNFMPGAVGGDVAKTYDLYRYTKSGKFAMISVFLERFTGLIGLSIISIIALIIGFRTINSPLILLAVGGTSLFLVLVVLMIWYAPVSNLLIKIMEKVFPHRLGEKFRQLYSALASYRTHKKTLAIAIGLSVIVQFLMAIFYSITALALGIPISVQYFILFLPVITLITMIPVSFGGLGVREALMVLLFNEVGISSADILSVSLTVHILNTLLSLWGGALMLLRRPMSERERTP